MKDLRKMFLTGAAFGAGFSVASLLFNILLQAILFGVFQVLGLRG
jgi:hypothetical protein